MLKKTMVGEVVFSQSSETNGLHKGAGQTEPLNRIRNFQRRPHLREGPHVS